jgi:hypothetical protein
MIGLLAFATFRKINRGTNGLTYIFLGFASFVILQLVWHGAFRSLKKIQQDIQNGRVERRSGILQKSTDANSINIEAETLTDYYGKFKILTDDLSYNIYVAPRSKILLSLEERQVSEWELTHGISPEDLASNRLGQVSERQVRQWYATSADIEITPLHVMGMAFAFVFAIFFVEELLAQNDELWQFAFVKVFAYWALPACLIPYFNRKRRKLRTKYDPSRGTVHHFDFQKHQLVHQPNVFEHESEAEYLYEITQDGRTFELFDPSTYELLDENVIYRLYYVIYADDIDHDMLSFEALEQP